VSKLLRQLRISGYIKLKDALVRMKAGFPPARE
jgi:hypothetical protein